VRAGVPGFPDAIDPVLWLDPPALSAELTKLAPMWPRGEGSGYHPLTWGYIAGELVRRVLKRSLGTILRGGYLCATGASIFWIVRLCQPERTRALRRTAEAEGGSAISAQECRDARRPS